MANSKRKGSKFEREVAKWLTSWTGYQFQRTPYSGANHLSRDLASDIMCSDERHAHRCKISVECKFYKDIKFEHVLLGTKSCEIEKFWSQAKRDATRSKKIPLLVMRYNSMPRNEFFILVDEDLGLWLRDSMKKHRYMYLNIPDNPLYVFMASYIRETINYKLLHKEVKKLLIKTT